MMQQAISSRGSDHIWKWARSDVKELDLVCSHCRLEYLSRFKL